MKLKILVGTMTGTADLVAQAIQIGCADLMSDINVLPMDDLDINTFSLVNSKNTFYLICTSTYGQGDVPDNASALYESLATEPQFLGHMYYGVIALGDATYQQTFCFGGKKFDERLSDLGAQRIGDVWCHDASASTQPEDEGLVWCREWLTQALRQLPADSETA